KGFSNRPLVPLVGLDLGGRITGARLVHHSEPMVHLGVSDEEFQRFAENYKGLDVRTGVDVVVKLSPAAAAALGRDSFSAGGTPGGTAAPRVDAISRATTSSLLISDAIVRGARIIASGGGGLTRRTTSCIICSAEVRVDCGQLALRDLKFADSPLERDGF